MTSSFQRSITTWTSNAARALNSESVIPAAWSMLPAWSQWRSRAWMGPLQALHSSSVGVRQPISAKQTQFGFARMLSAQATLRRDHYNILGLNRGATLKEVKEAYRKKAMLHHPDRAVGCKKTAEDEFKQISEAHSVLSDAHKRGQYDRGVTDFDYEPSARPGSWEWEEVFHHDFVDMDEERKMTQAEAERIIRQMFGKHVFDRANRAGKKKKKKQSRQRQARSSDPFSDLKDHDGGMDILFEFDGFCLDMQFNPRSPDKRKFKPQSRKPGRKAHPGPGLTGKPSQAAAEQRSSPGPKTAAKGGRSKSRPVGSRAVRPVEL